MLPAAPGSLRLSPAPLAGLGAQLLLLAALAETVGLRRAGWVVGVASGLILDAALAYQDSSVRSEALRGTWYRPSRAARPYPRGQTQTPEARSCVREPAAGSRRCSVA